ncbi:hypothetical protein [Nonomuraea sp. CA-141351]|uniref:hypothetical protein n=1 Tax=Nonomuraea sp. CA-141351 TaxID=3239996 RepID=UPI003D8FC55C
MEWFRGVKSSSTPSVMVDGSPIELARRLNNLLDNAERHATSAVTVTLTLGCWRRGAGGAP